MSCQSMLGTVCPAHLQMSNAILRDLILIQLQPLELGEPSDGFCYGNCTHPPDLHVHTAAIAHSSTHCCFRLPGKDLARVQDCMLSAL